LKLRMPWLGMAVALGAWLPLGCEPYGGFTGAWRVRLAETDRAYWVAPAGNATRTLVLKEDKGAISGEFEDMPGFQLAGAADGDRARLGGSAGDTNLTLRLAVTNATLTGEMKRSVRDDYGGWWRWELNGRRESGLSLERDDPLP
jgi:hypothetical protein